MFNKKILIFFITTISHGIVISNPLESAIINIQSQRLGDNLAGFCKAVWLSYKYGIPYYYSPFIGVGGEIEFEGINTRLTEREDKNAISQWGLWLKGGWAY